VLEVENCPYERLEVSSPGLDRPLKKAADFDRFAGEPLNLTLKMPFKGRKKFKGRLAANPAGGWRLLLDAEPDAAEDMALDFQLEEVREARLVPVLDFKGRRFLPVAPLASPEGGLGGAGVDGGRKR